MGAGRSRVTISSQYLIGDNSNIPYVVKNPILDAKGDKVLVNFLSQKVSDSDFEHKTVKEIEGLGTEIHIGVEPNPFEKDVKKVLRKYGLSFDNDFLAGSKESVETYNKKMSARDKGRIDVFIKYEFEGGRISGDGGSNPDPFRPLAGAPERYNEQNRRDVQKGINLGMRAFNILNSKVVKEMNLEGVKVLHFGRFGRAHKGTAGGYYPWGSLHINTTSMSTVDPSFDFAGLFRKSGKHAFGNLNGSIAVAHEYGHHIDRLLGNISIKYFKRLEKTRPDIVKEGISNYGTSKFEEAFAESFAAYCFGVQPKNGTLYHKEFKKIMKENGLQGFEGCLKVQKGKK